METPRGTEKSVKVLSRPSSYSGASLWQQPGGGNVKVVVRVKPEDGPAAKGVLQIRDNSITVLQPKPLPEFEGFSWVAGPNSTQDDLMARVGEPMIESLRSGFNSTILAYGDSGSGKTHTMIGPPVCNVEGQEGLIPRVLKSLFSQLTAEFGPATPHTGAASSSCAPSVLQSENCDAASVADDCSESTCGGDTPRSRVTWSADMAFLQIYKRDEITNLLSAGYEEKGSAVGQKQVRLVSLLESGQSKLPRDVVQFLRRKGAMVPVTTAGEALARLRHGARLRSTSATINNAESSRSHAVFVLELTIRTPRPDGSWMEQSPQLVMMDLAGSESYDSSANTSETAAINTGLLFLGNVLRDLADAGERGRGGGRIGSSGGGGNGSASGSSGGGGGGSGGGSSSGSGAGPSINFNNHNLTRFLEHSMDSRGRGGKVALIVTVRLTPPDRLPHSLRFAQKALSIKISAAKNEHLHARNAKKLAEKLQAQVEELQIEVQQWRDRHDEAVEASRRELTRQLDSRAAALEARHLSEAGDLRRRAESAERANEELRLWLAAADKERDGLLEAKAEEAAAMRELLERADWKASDAAEEARRRDREVAALKQELRMAREHLARERLEAVEEAARAAAAAEAAAAERLEQQAAALGDQHERSIKLLELAHSAELRWLTGELEAARSSAVAAEQQMSLQAAETQAASAELRRHLEEGRAAHEATRRELCALRHDRDLRRQSLLRAKEVVREVREDGTALNANGAGDDEGSRAATRNGSSRDSLQRESSVRRSGGSDQLQEWRRHHPSPQGPPGREGSHNDTSGHDRDGVPHHAASRRWELHSNGRDVWRSDSGASGDDAEAAAGQLAGDAPSNGSGGSIQLDDSGSDHDSGSSGDGCGGPDEEEGLHPERPLSLSPVAWLQQAVRSPQSISRQTTHEKARMLRHVIASIRWEAAGIMRDSRAVQDEDGSAGGCSQSGGGRTSSCSSLGGDGGTWQQEDTRQEASGRDFHMATGNSEVCGWAGAALMASQDEHVHGMASHGICDEGRSDAGTEQLPSAPSSQAASSRGPSPGSEDAYADGAGATAPVTSSADATASDAQPKRRRQLRPPQPRPDCAAARAALARAAFTRAPLQQPRPRSASPGGWLEHCGPEAAEPASKEERAALDRQVLEDMRARHRRRERQQRDQQNAAEATGREEGLRNGDEGEGDAGHEEDGWEEWEAPHRVTVELLAACLQGKRLGGAEWRRGGKKRHELVRDYLAWAAANPGSQESPGPGSPKPGKCGVGGFYPTVPGGGFAVADVGQLGQGCGAAPAGSKAGEKGRAGRYYPAVPGGADIRADETCGGEHGAAPLGIRNGKGSRAGRFYPAVPGGADLRGSADAKADEAARRKERSVATARSRAGRFYPAVPDGTDVRLDEAAHCSGGGDFKDGASNGRESQHHNGHYYPESSHSHHGQQQQQQQQWPVGPPSPAMVVLQQYAETPPPTKLLSRTMHHRRDDGAGDGRPAAAAAAAAAASGRGEGPDGHAMRASQADCLGGVAHADIFAEGSRRFCESQLPRNYRAF